MLLVDVFKSESFGTRIQQKRDLITELAVLAFSAIQNNDKVGVVFFYRSNRTIYPTKKRKISYSQDHS